MLPRMSLKYGVILQFTSRVFAVLSGWSEMMILVQSCMIGEDGLGLELGMGTPPPCTNPPPFSSVP